MMGFADGSTHPTGYTRALFAAAFRLEAVPNGAAAAS